MFLGAGVCCCKRVPVWLFQRLLLLLASNIDAMSQHRLPNNHADHLHHHHWCCAGGSWTWSLIWFGVHQICRIAFLHYDGTVKYRHFVADVLWVGFIFSVSNLEKNSSRQFICNEAPNMAWCYHTYCLFACHDVWAYIDWHHNMACYKWA